MPYASDLVANIDADTRKFDRKAAAVDRTQKRLASADPTVTVDADTRKAQAEIRSVEQALTGIEDESVSVLAATDAAQADIQSVEASLAGLGDESVAVTADTGTALGDIQGVEAALVGIEDQDVRVTVEGDEARAEVQTIEAALAGLEDQTVRVTVEAQELSATLAGLGTGMGGVAGSSRSMGSSIGGTAAETLALGAAVDSADGRLDMLGGRMGAVVGKVGLLRAGVAGLAGGAVVAGFTKLSMGAAELDDAVNATNVVFGESRSIINEWGRDSVQRVGLAESSFRSLAAPLGALMRSLGATGDEVAHMSTEVISLGADFASVLGGSTEDAVNAIGAAFRGETEPIRRYGITLDAAAVQERALAMGLVDGTGKIKNRAAVLRDLIFEQAEANGIVGDFEKTQREGVNAVRMMTNNLGDAADELGRAFVPAMVAGANAVSDLTEQVGPLIDVAVWLGERALPAAAKGVGYVVQGVLAMIPGAEAARDALETLGVATERNAQMASYAKGSAAGYADRQSYLKDMLAQTKDPANDAADGIEGVGDAAGTTRTKVVDLHTALDNLIGVNVSAEQAQIRFEESLIKARESLRENGHHLDGTSEKTLKVRGDVASMAEAALGAAEALKEQRAGHTVVNESLATARTRMIDLMVAEGMTRQAAEAHLVTLGFSKEALNRVAVSTDTARWRTDEMKGAISTAQGAVSTATGVFGGWVGKLGETTGAANTTKGATDNLRGSIFGIPTSWHTRLTGDTSDADAKFDAFVRKWSGADLTWQAKLKGNVTGDGPGRGAGGPALAKVRQAMQGIPGLAVTSTYRSPAANRRAGGAPNSYHMDRSNPAVDVGGSPASLDRLNARLRMMGGWREGPIWRAPGHYDHLHVAHGGGTVSSSWYRMPGDGPDERTVRLQVGEQVIPRMHAGGTVGGGGNTYVTVVVQGSLVRERDVARQIDRVMVGSARGRGR